jgi:electron transport complex protein RnfD
MSAATEIRSAPHIKSAAQRRADHANVVYSLLPVCAFFIFQYGLSAAGLAARRHRRLPADRAVLRAHRHPGRQPVRLFGHHHRLLLALTLPPGFPLWMGAVAGVVAIALGKALFGGIGFNVFNPALVGRAFVQAAFPAAIATYTPSFLPGRFTEFIPSTLAWPLMAPADRRLAQGHAATTPWPARRRWRAGSSRVCWPCRRTC